MWCKLSTAATITVGPILDSAGAEYTGAVIGDLSLRKHDGSESAMASAATLTHVSNGLYTLVTTTGNLDTLGRAQIRCNKSTYQMPTVNLMVVPAMVFDSMVLGTDRFDVNLTHWLDTAPLALSSQQVQAVVPDTQKVDLNTVKTQAITASAAVTINPFVGTSTAAVAVDSSGHVTTGTVATGAITAAAIATGAIDADAIAADAVTEIQSGLATAANLATVAGYLDTEIAAIVADTNELQTDWADGGRLDAILDARASQTSVNTIDGIVDDILVDTAVIGAAGAGLTDIPKTGYKLASDGLDSVATTAPAGVASNFREMLVQTWRRWFKKTVYDIDDNNIKTFADDGSTVVTTQTTAVSATEESVGAAS